MLLPIQSKSIVLFYGLIYFMVQADIKTLKRLSVSITKLLWVCLSIIYPSLIYSSIPNENLFKFRPTLVLEADLQITFQPPRKIIHQNFFEEFHSKLPIIQIITPNREIISNSKRKITAWIRIIDQEDQVENYLSDSATFTGYIGVEIRGSSSTDYPQKSYNVETRDAQGANLNISVLGMPPENDWALITNYNDKTLLRNTLTHHLFSHMGHYAPRSAYVEVFINDQYQGIYLWSEKIKRDDGRVDIKKPNILAIEGDDLTGGFILKNDNRDADDYVIFSHYSEKGVPGAQEVAFIVVEPKADEISMPQSNYLNKYLRRLEDAIYGPLFKDSVIGYRAFLDVPSFIDYFIIGEVSRSVDAYKKSKFYYKDVDSKGGKLHSGPTWDFDWAYKNIPEGDPVFQCYYGAQDGSGWAFRAGFCQHWPPFPGWIPRLLQDGYFTGLLEQRYKTLRQSILSDDYLFQFIDSVHIELIEASKTHFVRWPILGVTSIGSPETNPQPASYTAALNQLKNWLSIRLSWLDKNLPTLNVHQTEETKLVVKIYPNPVTQTLHVESTHPIRHIEMVDLTGKRWWSTEINAVMYSLNILTFPSGFYYIKIVLASGHTENHKVIFSPQH